MLENVLEAGVSLPATASSIVRATRAYARITDDGEWVDPPRRIEVTRLPAEAPDALSSPPERRILIGTQAQTGDDLTR